MKVESIQALEAAETLERYCKQQIEDEAATQFFGAVAKLNEHCRRTKAKGQCDNCELSLKDSGIERYSCMLDLLEMHMKF